MKKTDKKKCDTKQCPCCEKTIAWIKDNQKYLVIAICFFVLGFCLRIFTASPSTVCNAALVDVQQLVQNTPEAKAIQDEFDQKRQELQKWADVEKAKAVRSRRKDLIDQFEETFAQKQADLQSEYTRKVNELDGKVSKILHNTAKAQGFNMVLAKNAVLDGGTDITADVIELVK